MFTFNTSIFKAYDIRGIYPNEINEDLVYRIAQAYANFLNPKVVVLSKDVRLSGPSLWEAAKNGLTDAGVNVIDIGVVSTDMMYFAVANYGYDGGITISASHNPKEYNGMKFVRENSIPVASDSGLQEMINWINEDKKITKEIKGTVEKKDILDDYCRKVLTFLDTPLKRKYKIVANANFGMAGIALRKLIELGNLPIELIELNFSPDGNFPKGRPDPLRPESRVEMIETIKKIHPDLGVAWDADADRCFFFDENSDFVEGYFVTAMQSKYFLKKFNGGKVISDTRQVWAVKHTVEENGGEFILHRAGYSLIKETMRKIGAIFAGETSAHYYYKDMFNGENGMVALLIMLQIADNYDRFSSIFKPLRDKYFVSGEINTEVKNPKVVLKEIEDKYSESAKIDKTDGISFEYTNWRFNLRLSNTESIPLLRLNLEALNKSIMEEKTKEVIDTINLYKDKTDE